MQARYYDPVIGRFYSNDPVGYVSRNSIHSFNRFAYASNNPYKYVDPDGNEVRFAVAAQADTASYTSGNISKKTLASRTATTVSAARSSVKSIPAARLLSVVLTVANALSNEAAVDSDTVMFEGETDSEDLSADEIAAIEKENKQDAIDKAFEDYQSGDATGMDGDDIGRNTKNNTEKDLGYDDDNE